MQLCVWDLSVTLPQVNTIVRLLAVQGYFVFEFHKCVDAAEDEFTASHAGSLHSRRSMAFQTFLSSGA